MSGSVYFIEAIGTGLIKIGFTRQSVGQRLQALQVASPMELKLLAWIDVVASSRREDTLHCRFSHLHVRGEWYMADASLRDYIAEVRAAGPTEAVI